MAETAATTIRLTDEDRSNAQRMLDAGYASTVADAIRVALKEYATKVPRMAAIERRLHSVESSLARWPFDRLVAMASADSAEHFTIKHEAERELLRRGYFPDGLGHWVEDKPDLTTRVAPASQARAARR